MRRKFRCVGLLAMCASVLHWTVWLRWQEPVPKRVEPLNAAFVTLLIARPSPEMYTGFLESSTRLREAFTLERAYPHVVFYDQPLHEAAIRRHAPWVIFRNISNIWGNVPVPEREANDRSVGYNHMCRFYAMQIFDFDYDLIMRVDDDVFVLSRVPYDPFRLMARSPAVYAYGVRNVEEHAMTRDTLTEWLPEVGSRVVQEMFFNNLFLTKTQWWRSRRVRAFFAKIDESQGIYRWRWGDAPLQTATLMYFNASVLKLPSLNYVHFSTANLIIDGDLQCLNCDTAASYLRHTSNLTARVEIHRSSFQRDLARLLNRTIDVSLMKLVKLAETATIWCDGAGRVENIELLPRFCCCSLAPFGLGTDSMEKLHHILDSYDDDVICPVVSHACDRTHDKCASGLPETPSLCDAKPPSWADLQRNYAQPRNTARVAARKVIGDGALALSELAARLKHSNLR